MLSALIIAKASVLLIDAIYLGYACGVFRHDSSGFGSRPSDQANPSVAGWAPDHRRTVRLRSFWGRLVRRLAHTDSAFFEVMASIEGEGGDDRGSRCYTGNDAIGVGESSMCLADRRGRAGLSDRRYGH